MKIILASASPRRKEILERLNLEFDVVKSEIKEDISDYLTCWENVERLAYEKAVDVNNKVSCKSALIISADTMVALNGQLIGKPSDDIDAFHILKSLSGKVHQVYTGLCVYSAEENRGIVRHSKTNVKFDDIDDEIIWRYINTGEVRDKAGAYAIQGLGSLFVESIEGDYTNVVGLPVILLRKMLAEFNVNII